jgi:hypothetical protein
MANCRLTRVLDCLLNRGTVSPTDTRFFQTLKHEVLVDTLAQYLNAHRRFLSRCHIETTQALNDKGVDLLLEADGIKVGFQIKSHYDVTEKDFNRKVKAQFSEALSFGLDHYYVLFCAAMIKDGTNDFGMKVTHLRNELALFRNVNFTVYGPQTTATLFRKPPTVTRHELLLNDAISDDALHDHELGFEHQPEISDEELTEAESILDAFGDDWFDSEDGQKAFDSYMAMLHRKQAEQFEQDYLPTIPEDVRGQRTALVDAITALLQACRDCDAWDDRSEYKLNIWIEHVPEDMIPYTSLPNLLKIQQSLMEYLKIHQDMKTNAATCIAR